MEDVTRIVLALEAHDVMEEVMHFLDRSGMARVVATAGDPRQLEEAVRQLEPDAVVASPGLARSAERNGRVLLAIDTAESVRSLRDAIRAGARGFFLWPAERAELAGATAALGLRRERLGDRRAVVVAVLGSRGGAGATFVTTHLAASAARRGRECVLVDMDRLFGDVAAALGVPAEPGIRTLADVLPLIEELSEHHLDEILWRHPQGFRVLLAPEDPEVGEALRGEDYRAVIDVARTCSDVVVLHVPRMLDGVARACLDVADRILVVLSLDVLSFRDAKRAVTVAGIGERCDFIVNRAARSEITPNDVQRVFGRRPLAVLPSDSSVRAAQDRGRLLPPRGRSGRALDRLAKRLLEEGG